MDKIALGHTIHRIYDIPKHNRCLLFCLSLSLYCSLPQFLSLSWPLPLIGLVKMAMIRAVIKGSLILSGRRFLGENLESGLLFAPGILN